MVNYLSSDPAVRDHMEGAIGTVLKFSDDEMSRIDKKREEVKDKWLKIGKWCNIMLNQPLYDENDILLPFCEYLHVWNEWNKKLTSVSLYTR